MNRQNNNSRNRTQMRTKVFECVYQYFLNPSSEFDLEVGYEKDTFDGIVQYCPQIRELIAKYSKGFEFDRIYKVDLSILFLAIYEIKYNDDIPTEVAIDQALQLCKIYSTPKSSSFVNGILASIVGENLK